MGKIDKKKFIKELTSAGFLESGEHQDFIKNFPEEPEQPIDFDVFFDEFNKVCTLNCYKCQFIKYNNVVICYNEFLKSKNITAQKPFEIPVKKTWTLKKEYKDFLDNTGAGYDEDAFTTNTKPKFEKYYDLHEEPDYSKITDGSIVEVKNDQGTHYRKFSHFDGNYIWLYLVDGQIADWPKTSFVRIVELAKE